MSFTLLGSAPFSGKAHTARKYLVGSFIIFTTLALRMIFARRAEAELKAIAWLLREGRRPFQTPKPQPYGDLTELNNEGTILRTVGKDFLVNVAGDALHLIGTSL